MSSNRKKTDQPAGSEEVVELARLRERLQVQRQDRAAAQLAARFHDAMGWDGKSGKQAAKKKPKRKKK